MEQVIGWIKLNGEVIIQILLVIVLLLLIFFLIRMSVFIKKISKTVEKVNNSLDMVNDYLDEMQVPVRTVVNVATSIETLRAASEATVREMAEKISSNIQKIKATFKEIWETITRFLKKEEKVDIVETESVEIAKKEN